MDHVLALDQGTTSSRAIVFDRDGRPVATAQREFRQIFPNPGWVEHDPEEIWTTQIATAVEALGAGLAAAAGRGRDRHHEPARDHDRVGPRDRPARGQRDRLAGPAHRRRSATGCAPTARRTWSASAPASCSMPTSRAPRSRWILDNVPGARARAEAGKLAFGTVDTWLAAPPDQRPAPRHRPEQRLADAALQHPHRRVGRRAAAPLRRAPQRASRGPRLERGLRRGVDQPRPAGPAHRRASRAISRPRSSASVHRAPA